MVNNMDTKRIEAVRNEYDRARNLPRTEGRVDGRLVHKTALALVQAWSAWDKAHKDKGV